MATKRVSPQTPSTPPKITTKRTKRAAPKTTNGSTHDGHDHRHELVAAEAYYLAERRGFAAGHELEDWVAAEKMIAARA
jgi:hypothetical protein